MTDTDLPRVMLAKERCLFCREEMEIHSAFLRDDESGVEVWYQCKCGQRLGFVYTGGHIAAFKKAIGIEDIKSSQSCSHDELETKGMGLT